MSKYDYQKETFRLWSGVDFRGVLWGVPSCGKTRAGAICIAKYVKMNPLARVWVIAPSKVILSQWEKEVYADCDIEYLTYSSATTKFSKHWREKKDILNPDLLVLDECHSVMAPTWGKVLDFGVKHILGLSGTPNGSEKKIGPIFQKVSWDEANIAPSKVFLGTYTPSDTEQKRYAKMSESITKYRTKHPRASYYTDSNYAFLINKRRRETHMFESRLPIALELVKANKTEKIMVFCMMIEQAKQMSALLENEGIDHRIHVTGKEEMDDFIEGKTNILISCKKLSQGFNYPPANVGIIVSTATSPLTATQTLARIIRPLEGKEAKIYFILAKGTSDLALKDKNIFTKEDTIEMDYDVAFSDNI